ncbi:MAG: riboflavin biosynthesis protein RibF [Defluviitaleaceae bacterium]|nr:riboflavin biosynthesis protein RibF [Defluviitaleaceae bacterium]
MKNCCTIGKFEGIHLGHQALLKEVIRLSHQKNLIPTVVVFHPHPYKLLHDPSYKPLFTPTERDSLLKNFGIQNIITLPFDQSLVNMEAGCFGTKLTTLANTQQIVVGENFRFGKNRTGTIETLLENNFEVKTVGLWPNVPHKPLKRLGPNFGVLSTSGVRALLEEGKLSEAAELLGFSFFIAGEVTKGQQLGRVLGFPTLNVYPPGDKFLPAFGVYETLTQIEGGERMQGLTNVGLRPTVTFDQMAQNSVSVETHIPSLVAKPDEMYGRQIKVEFIRFIRSERRFDSTEALQEQIKNDIKELQK